MHLVHTCGVPVFLTSVHAGTSFVSTLKWEFFPLTNFGHIKFWHITLITKTVQAIQNLLVLLKSIFVQLNVAIFPQEYPLL